MLLLLFRITYACLSGLPIESLNCHDIVFAIVPFFCHINKDVQVAAMNAGQFLIPFIKGSKSTRQLFVLNNDNIDTLLCAFGTTMPVSSSLQLLHSFSALPENCSLFMSKGIALLSTSIMILSTRQVEKELAFDLLKKMFQEPSKGSTTSIESSNMSVNSLQMTYSDSEAKGEAEGFVECDIEDVLQRLKMIVQEITSNDLSSLPNHFVEVECLLKHLKGDLTRHVRSEIEAVLSLLLPIAQRITKSKHIWSIYVNNNSYLSLGLAWFLYVLNILFLYGCLSWL